MTALFSAYVICGTPRSGSTLLCEMLGASGVAGRPNSFFRAQDIAYWSESWGVPISGGTESAQFDRDYLAAMVREGTADTGIFGIRIMWPSIAEATLRLDRAHGDCADIVARFASLFGPVLYIHLCRGDKVAQAVSLLRAERSGRWHLAADGSVLEGGEVLQDVTYDPVRIAEIVAELEVHQAEWEAFFTNHRIKPLRLVYETMTADPQHALADIFAALGRDREIALRVTVKTSKMADATSREWIDRFKVSRGA